MSLTVVWINAMPSKRAFHGDGSTAPGEPTASICTDESLKHLGHAWRTTTHRELPTSKCQMPMWAWLGVITPADDLRNQLVLNGSRPYLEYTALSSWDSGESGTRQREERCSSNGGCQYPSRGPRSLIPSYDRDI